MTAEKALILYCTHEGVGSGAAVHIHSFVTAARRQGARIILATPDAMTTAPSASAGAGLRRRLPAAVRELGILGVEVLRLYRGWRLTRRTSPDVVLSRVRAFGWYEWVLARWLRIPLVLEINAPMADARARHKYSPLAGMARRIERFLYRHADASYCVSDEVRTFVLSAGAAPSRTRTIPNGVDLDLFGTAGDRDEVRSALGLAPNDLAVAFVSGFRPWHGLDVLLDAARQLQGEAVVFVLVGDGPRRGEIEARVRAGGLTDMFRFVGAVPHDAVPRYLHACDAAAMPHQAGAGAFFFSPLKLFEYMGAGLPTVATRVGQMEGVLDDGETGILVEPDDISGWAAALRGLASAPEFRDRLGAAARRRAATHHSWEANARAVLELVDLGIRYHGKQIKAGS